MPASHTLLDLAVIETLTPQRSHRMAREYDPPSGTPYRASRLTAFSGQISPTIFYCRIDPLRISASQREGGGCAPPVSSLPGSRVPGRYPHRCGASWRVV